MLSKFKITSVGENSFSSRFKVYPRTNSEPTQVPLIEVYEAEVRRLRAENNFLKTQYNSMFVQLNTAHNQLQQANAQISHLQQKMAPFYSTKKDFWQLGRSGRNKKKRRLRQLVLESVKGLEEFVPLEVSSPSLTRQLWRDVNSLLLFLSTLKNF